MCHLHPECTAVAAIQLRMRMQILTRPENPLANSRGPVPVRLPAAAPGNHSGGFPCPEWVSATVAIRICDIVWLLVLALVLSVLCPWSLVKHKEWAK